MISFAPIPKISDFLNLEPTKFALDMWKTKKDNAYFYSKSTWALFDICETLQEKSGRQINIFLPSFFCEETITPLLDDRFRIIYYKVQESLDPDWKDLEDRFKVNNPDIFLLTHFFGKEADVNKAGKLAKKYKTLFIEDCAHVMFPTGQIGKKSDYSVYSIYKHFGLPNGSILIDKNKSKLKLPFEKSIKMNEQFKSALIWSCKRVIQNILSLNSAPLLNSFKQEEYTTEINRENFNILSNRILESYDRTRIETIVKKNVVFLKLWNELIKTILTHREIEVLSSRTCPYLAAFRIKDLSEDDVNKLVDLGIPFFNWPKLPEIIANNSEYVASNKIKKEVICFPLNDSLEESDFLNILNKLEVDKISLKEEMSNTQFKTLSSIVQCNEYVESKSRLENFNLRQIRINKADEEIGRLSVLEKNVGPFKVCRINRGPYLKENLSIKEKIEAYKLIKTHLKTRQSLIVWKPEVELDYLNLYKKALGIKISTKSTYHSSLVSLDNDIDTLRSDLNSKWRNQLKKSESNELDLVVSNERLDLEFMLEEYSKNMQSKEFSGVSKNVLEDIYRKSPEKIRIYLAKKDDEIIAGNIVYVDSGTGTYLIGWNGPKGRTFYANNFLLWNIISDLKSTGATFFDLGGLDLENTPAISKFKQGVNGKEYKIPGDLIALF